MVTNEQNGMKTFFIVWLGQLVSLVGSKMTGFALGVWVFQDTGSATSFGIIYILAFLPGLLIAPFAGVWVDRHDRRIVMILSDVISGACTFVIVILIINNALLLWHIYLLIGIMSLAEAFQDPAYHATVALLIPKAQLGRMNGLMQISQATRQIIAPAVAGFLLASIGLQGVILIDVLTFIFAVATLAIVRFPRPEAVEGETEKRSFWQESAFGWHYIKARPGLVAILSVMALFSFLVSIASLLITPLVLSFASEEVLGLQFSAGGLGMFIGGIVMSTWGGPKQRVRGILGFMVLAGLAMALHGLAPSPVLVIVAAVPFFFTLPFIMGSDNVIWQIKVPPAVQGRVFATRRMLMQILRPLGFFLAGPLADRVFEPLLMADGALANNVGQVIGVGQGRGMGLIFVIAGSLIALVSAAGYLYPRLRQLENEIPDALPDEPTTPATPEQSGAVAERPSLEGSTS